MSDCIGIVPPKHNEPKPDRCPTCDSDRAWSRRAPWCTWPDGENDGRHDKWHDIPTEHDAPPPAPQDEAAKPETQADSAALREHALLRHGICCGAQVPPCGPTVDAIARLADALAEKDLAYTEIHHHMRNLTASLENRNRENASLLKRAEDAEHRATDAEIAIDVRNVEKQQAIKRAEAAERTNHALGDMHAIDRDQAGVLTAERDEARRLHDQHCYHGDYDSCVPPWRQER